MKHRSTFKYLAMCSTCLFPLAAAAQGFDIEEAPAAPAPAPTYTSVIEGGIGYQSADSLRFGRFTGLDAEGPLIIGNASILRRAPYDSGDPSYWKLDAGNVGVESRSLRAEYGRQGRYKAFVGYDQIPSLRFDDARTPYNGVGTGSLTLPAGFVRAPNQAGMTTLLTSLNDVDIEQERKRFGGGLQFSLGNGLSFSTSVRREIKEGLKTIGGAFGSNGGNPSAIILPEPVDYQSDDFKAALSYVAGAFQAEVAYSLSMFDNEIDSLTFDNPYSAQNSGGAWAAPVSTTGQMALAPDNTAHQISLTGGYNISPTTRISANFGYGWHMQDEAFLPYSTNAALITAPLPRSSLDGEIVNTLAGVQLTSRPMERLDLRASYRYYDRDNNTPQATYTYVPGDVAVAGADPLKIRINHPYSFTEHLAKIGAGYRLTSRTRVTADYDYRVLERTHSEVEENTEHTGKARIAHSFGPMVSASAAYTYSNRDGSEYVGNRPFLEGTPAAAGLVGVASWENHPNLRKYFEANRVRNAAAATLNIFPSDKLAVGVTGTYGDEDYDDSEFGLTDVKNYTGTLDVSYVPSAGTNTYAFYTYDRRSADQASRQFSGGGAKAAQSADPTRNWWLDTKDKVHTLGLGLTYALSDTWTVGAEYLMSLATTSYDMTAGASIQPVTSPPDVKSRLNSVSLSADYKIRQNLSLRLGYVYENYSSSDWQIDNLTPATVPVVIGLGEQSPDYDVHLVGVTARYRF